MYILNIFEPQVRVCPGQNAPRFPPAGNQFIKDIVTIIQSSNDNISACTVDGYIVDTDNNISRIIFKREFNILNIDSKFEFNDEIKEKFFLQFNSSLDLIKNKNELKIIASQLGCGIDILFIPEDHPFSKKLPINNLFLLTSEYPFTSASPKILDIHEYSNRIFSFRKRSFMNPKPITVASSYLECFLANDCININPDGTRSSNPFPGDIDLVIIQDLHVALIGEFKTHNLSSNIENESCANYQKADWRRLHVLIQLITKLNCNLFYIFWGPKHDYIKIEEIDKNCKIVANTILPKTPNALIEHLKSRIK